MNREIKIKVWDSEQKYMVPEVFDRERFAKLGDCYSHDEHIHLLFTGLKDKNGVEIYEEDICKFYELVNGDGCGNSEWIEYIGEIIFEKGCYKFKFGNSKVIIVQLSGELEKIGNNYENPELLEEIENE